MNIVRKSNLFKKANTAILGVLLCLVIQPLVAMEPTKRTAEPTEAKKRTSRPEPIAAAFLPNTEPIVTETIFGLNGSPAKVIIHDALKTPPHVTKTISTPSPYKSTRAKAEWKTREGALNQYSEHIKAGIAMPSPKTATRAHRVSTATQRMLKVEKRAIEKVERYPYIKRTEVSLDFDAEIRVPVAPSMDRVSRACYTAIVNTCTKTTFHDLLKEDPSSRRFLCQICNAIFSDKTICNTHINGHEIPPASTPLIPRVVTLREAPASETPAADLREMITRNREARKCQAAEDDLRAKVVASVKKA